jgi:predicted transcriptional regulator
MLRSVHLPADLDDKVRQLAFDMQGSNSDVIRKLIQAQIKWIDQQFGGDVAAIAKYLASIDVPGTKVITDGFEEDLLRIRHAVELAELQKKNA